MRTTRPRAAFSGALTGPAVPGLVLGLTVAGLTVAGASVAPPAAAAACSATSTSTMYLKGTVNDYEIRTYITYSGVTITTKPYYYRSDVDTGYSAVSVVGCRNPTTGVWSALGYHVDPVHKDLDLLVSGTTVSPRPHTADRGFGVFVQRVTANTVEVQSTVCTGKRVPLGAAGVARLLTSLPVPGPGWLGMAQYVVGLSVPGGEAQWKCAPVGTASLRWRFAADGTAGLVRPYSGSYVNSTSVSSDRLVGCPSNDRYCGISRRVHLAISIGR